MRWYEWTALLWLEAATCLAAMRELCSLHPAVGRAIVRVALWLAMPP